MRRFVIGDIHGCIHTLEALLWQQLKVTVDDELFFLGDYIDRGPASKAVVDLLLELRRNGYRITPLRGNHEQLLLDACDSEDMLRLWLYNGALATLQSFGVRHPRELSGEYKAFFAALPFYIETDVAILVHAGLNFDVASPLDDTETMLWDRSLQANPVLLGGRRLIAGHTPMHLSAVRRSLSQAKVLLDGGCVYGRASGYGYLCALELQSWELFVQPNVEKKSSVYL
ncbi:MAG: serine/threonine protein phosphatase [Candidatus Kapabacteria bacterium]|nr:serine/threonine protein phosphatase [Candidatus Kapabacteria bacterium]MCS7169094.1 serine/threonine protein phosphatase [Candidatus Kapabacteria bacterium]MDW7996772.1 metallophosphoesterase family protein [Bacteroidota bacterium]MDW8224835.1 metallophosphoesterase family protein [Bacteroidota bacterium]